MKTITKKLEPTGDLCIKFTEDEMQTLNIKEGDKFSFKEDKNGILLEKMSSLELDISDFSKETLEFLIAESIEKDVSVNQIINDTLEKALKHFENNGV
jgi:hypothetical protein